MSKECHLQSTIAIVLALAKAGISPLPIRASKKKTPLDEWDSLKVNSHYRSNSETISNWRPPALDSRMILA